MNEITICPYCGQKIRHHNGNYCSHCGKQLSEHKEISYKGYIIGIDTHKDEYFQFNENKNYITVSKEDGTVDSICKRADTYNGNIFTLKKCKDIIDYWTQ